MSQPIRRENNDVIEMKMRLDDIIKGIKGLVTMFFLIPSPAVKEGASTGNNPHHMAWQINMSPCFHTDGAHMKLMSCQIIVMKITTKCK